MKKVSFNENWIYHLGSGSGLEGLLGSTFSKPVTLPHDGSVELPRSPEAAGDSGNGFFEEKNCYYTKSFAPDPADEGKKFYLEFEGVYQNAFVFVNSIFAGKHPYGYGGFTLDITPYLIFGKENTIKVLIKNAVPSGRWYTGFGIYRDVHLMVANRMHLIPEGIHLTTLSMDEDLAVVRVDATIRNCGIGTRDAALMVQLLNMDGSVAAENTVPVTMLEGEQKAIRQNLYVQNPRAWDVDRPNLYGYRAILKEGDAVLNAEEGTFGIRTLQLDPQHGLRINGKTVKLRGGCIHHDNGIIGTAEFPHAAEMRVKTLKEAGYNAIRSAHYPMSRALLNACDRLGMLVMDEYSDVWVNTKVEFDYGAQMTEWWQQDVAAMINKDYNHPCVILYSIGNEISEAGNRFDAQWGRKITDLIRKMDDSRYTTFSMNIIMSMLERIAAQYLGNEGGAEINTTMEQLGAMMDMILRSPEAGKVSEEPYSMVDVAGYNYAACRYEQDGVAYPNRIIVGSETNPRDLDTNWALVEKLPYVIGDFSWTAWDYLGEAGIGKIFYDEPMGLGVYAQFPYKAAYCGDINLIGDRRPASYWRQSIWGLSEKPYIAVRPPQHHDKSRNMTSWCTTDAVRSWNWEGYEDKPITVEAYTDAQEAALYLNGVLVERKSVGQEKKNTVLFETTYQPGKLELVAYCDGQEKGRDLLVTAGQDIQLAAVADRNTIPSDGSDICYVDVSLVDGCGNFNPGACKAVTVQVEGGILQGYGSANPNSEENYFDTTANTFEGRIRAAIRASGKGNITVTFRAEGCEDAIIQIAAE